MDARQPKRGLATPRRCGSGRRRAAGRRGPCGAALLLGLAGVAAALAAPGVAGHAEVPAASEPAGGERPREVVEPTVDELCRAAVALALAEPARARSFIGRARAAGWLPELRFRAFRRFARTEGLTLDDTATTTPVDVSGVDDVRYEWRATWDLSRIVFNPDELQAHAEALRMADVRRDIQSLVIRLFFERKRLLASAPGRSAATDGAGGASGQGPEAAATRGTDERRRLRVLELEAELEALSGLPVSAGAPAAGRGEAVP